MEWDYGSQPVGNTKRRSRGNLNDEGKNLVDNHEVEVDEEREGGGKGDIDSWIV